MQELVEPGARSVRAGDALVLLLPAEPQHLGLARIFAGQVARHVNLSEDDVEDIKVAVSEAVTNAVRAHRDAGVDDPIVLRARVDSALLTIEVVDAGKGFDVAADVAEGVTPPQGLHEGSLGLTLIRALFPKVEISRNDDRGMTVRLSIDLPTAQA